MNYKEKVLKIYPLAKIKKFPTDSYYVAVEIYEENWIMKGKVARRKNDAWESAYEKIETSVLRKLTL